MKTTSLIEIRDFLHREGCAPAPWSTSGSALERLYDTLRQRQGDELFWSDLRDLTTRLEDRRFTPSRARGWQALGTAVTENLLDELRAGLPPVNGAPHPIREWIRSRVSAAALAGFLLLGTATACTDDDNQCRDEAEAHGLTGEEATVYSALVDFVDGSDLSLDERCAIFECLPDLDASYREGLLEQWQTMDDDQLGWRLDSLLNLCDYDDGDDDDCDDGCH